MFSKLINLFFIFLLINISYASNEESKLTGEYYHQYQEHKTSLFQLKLISCLSLISNSIKSREGNIYLHQAIKKTKLNREKFYDKYTIALITQCINNINEGQMDYLLIPENVDNYDLNNKTLLNLLKLDYEINSLELTYEENEISKALEEVVQKSEKNRKNKNSGFLSFDLNTIIKFASFLLPFGFILLFNNMRMMKKDQKKEMDESTKELLEMIKARGKNSPNYKETVKEDKDKDKEDKSNEKPKKD